MKILSNKEYLAFELSKRQLALEKENFEREKANILKEAEAKYAFDRKAIEDEWHCKIGQHIEEEISKERDKIHALLEKAIDVVSNLKSGDASVNILK